MSLIRVKKISVVAFLFLATVLLSGCTISFGGGGSQGDDGGVWKSVDSSGTWSHVVNVPVTEGKTASIANVNVRRMVLDPQDYNTIYLSTEKNGVIFTHDAGASWMQVDKFRGTKVRSVAVDPRDKCNLYALSANKMYKSTDCGRFWKDVYFHQNVEVFLTDIIVDHFSSNIVYMTTSAGEVLKSTNAGQTWTTAHRVNNGVFVDLVMDSRDSRIVYAATTKKGIFKTTDSGTTWASLGDGLKAYSNSHQYKSLVMDQATPGNLILVSKFGILRTRDGGSSWEVVDLLPASKQTTIYSMVVNPNNSNEIYYTTRTTLVKSLDGGITWSSQELPSTRPVNAMLINPADPKIVYMGIFDQE
jgi:photosystem II stability/assembly factor-like uncharacterized protein